MTAFEDQVIDLLKQINRHLAELDERAMIQAPYIEGLAETVEDIAEQLAKK
jgi:hypothetical protein